MQMSPRTLLSCLLVLPATAHTPAGAGDGTRSNPVDLGDVTKNSWALTGSLDPGAVKHYKFTIDGPTTSAMAKTSPHRESRGPSERGALLNVALLLRSNRPSPLNPLHFRLLHGLVCAWRG
jgi:hypothetical protein